MTDKLDIRRLLTAKIMEASINLASFTENEIQNPLALKQLVSISKHLEEVLETFSEDEKAMYEEEIDSINNSHPADRLEQLNELSEEEVEEKIQKARVNTLNKISDFIDPFTIKRNLLKD